MANISKKSPKGGRKSERGVASLLGIIGLIILAIGMYTSYNLSRAVYEKIKLQNAADAAAYSVATLEARTFNFIAFSNRAQIANYVQMLESQSLLSNATFAEGAIGRSGDILLTVGHWLEWTGLFTEVGEAMVILGEQFKTAYMGPDGNGGLKGLVNLMDNWSPRYIQLQTTRNHALFAVQGLLALLTAVQIADGASAIIVANDPNAQQNWLSYLLNAVNMASYATSFDTASFGSFSTEDEIQDARRVMAELVNASRYGSGDAEFIVARKSLGMFEQVLADLSGQDASEGGSKGTKAWEEAQKILSKNFTGTAKLLAAAEGDKADLDDTGKTSAGHSALTTPDALVAKDHMDTFSYGDFASVTSTADRGIHCRYKPKGSYGTMGNIIHLYPGSSHFKCEEEDRHKWQTLVPSIITKGGMASFLKFAPATNGFEIDRMSFNQPDVWVYLTKDVSSMSLGGAGDLDFQMSHGGQNVGLDARIGEDGLAGSGLARGMHVFARAQVYYHRPGAWQEMPNFFNPYWGARLAPKNAVSARLMNEMGLPESISRIISDNLWMH